MNEDRKVDQLICEQIADISRFLDNANLKLTFNKRTISFYDAKTGEFILSVSKSASTSMIGACVVVLTGLDKS
jgi:hypothetical protein